MPKPRRARRVVVLGVGELKPLDSVDVHAFRCLTVLFPCRLLRSTFCLVPGAGLHHYFVAESANGEFDARHIWFICWIVGEVAHDVLSMMRPEGRGVGLVGTAD